MTRSGWRGFGSLWLIPGCPKFVILGQSTRVFSWLKLNFWTPLTNIQRFYRAQVTVWHLWLVARLIPVQIKSFSLRRSHSNFRLRHFYRWLNISTTGHWWHGQLSEATKFSVTMYQGWFLHLQKTFQTIYLTLFPCWSTSGGWYGAWLSFLKIMVMTIFSARSQTGTNALGKLLINCILCAPNPFWGLLASYTVLDLRRLYNCRFSNFQKTFPWTGGSGFFKADFSGVGGVGFWGTGWYCCVTWGWWETGFYGIFFWRVLK